MEKKINVLALSWRDIKHPKHGGAEVHTHEMLNRVDNSKINVVHFSPMHEGALNSEKIDNVLYIRKGNNFSVIFFAYLYYRKNHNRIDFVIDQCNTHRFFTKFWVKKEKRIFFIHQLTKEIWDIMLKPPISTIGRFLEVPMLKLNKNDNTITVSESTKQELVGIGFDANKICIVNNGLNFEPALFQELGEKEENKTFIYVGRYSAYKGIDCSIEAFGMLKEKYPEAKLWLVGKANEEYIKASLIPIFEKYNLTYGSEENNDVVIWGFVSEEKKFELQKRARALLFPSIREGWGIIVIEAATVGTPSIVFNSPGCRDAVDLGQAGYLCKENTSQELKRLMENTIEDKKMYEDVRRKAYEFSTGFKWENSAKAFEEFIEKNRAN